MAGASITLLVLDDELTALWDAPVKTAALRWGVLTRRGRPTVDAETVTRWMQRVRRRRSPSSATT